MPTLAAAQTVPIPADVDANIQQHLLLMRAAEAEGVDLLVFPELSLTGYELGSLADVAFAEDDARLAPLRAEAIGGGIRLIVGAPVRRGSALHISKP